ncbi:TIGR03032 family protein [Schlesneria paludicola]|uniref:TIGR03032 family protein n=1 Tax=Schlesneria paludicola TaxID=360056 RepID=UPI00029A743C|nr:TIGR03032 family protein [Schlesneria paludicola]
MGELVSSNEASSIRNSSTEVGERSVREVRYEFTSVLPEILHRLGMTLLVSTYQAGKVLALGTSNGTLTVSFTHFDRAMGMAVDRTRIALGSRRQIHFLKSVPDLASQISPAGTFDGCWLPRSSFYTGNIHSHELAWGDDGLWVVNTLFSTLCTLNEHYSFVPRWQPRFISDLQGQDRCHLNGMAMDQGRPKYVTVLAESNEPAGWRPNKATAGCVIDVASQETVLRGLAMPHSPRLYQERLWVLNSGCGDFGTVDLSHGRFEPIENLPGYCRGLAFRGQYAFVGLSKIRETAVFGGVPIAANRENLKCGIAVIDLRIGRTVAVFQFHSGVEEIFAVEVVPQRNANLQGPGTDRDEDVADVWLVPSPGIIVRPEPTLAIYARPGQAEVASQENVLSAKESPSEEWERLVAEAHRFRAAGRPVDALARFQQAVSTAPEPANLLVDIGNLQQELGDQEAALQSYRRAIEVHPDHIPAWQNLVYLLFNRGETERAAEGYKTLLALNNSPLNQLLSATLLPVIYDSLDAVTAWRTRQETVLERMAAEQSIVDTSHQQIPTSFFMAYSGLNNRPLMERFGRIVRGPDRSRRKKSGRSGTNGRIRLGVLSAYFHDHTIGRLNIGRFEQLDKSRFELHVIYAGHARDVLQQRFRQAAEHFHPLAKDVASAREQIASLDLDLLLFADVGMDALTSTLAYSRMAPVQCVTWGHPETTGSPHMDYFISSRLLEVDCADEHYTERLVQLQTLGTYYERPVNSGVKLERTAFGLPAGKRLYLCPQTLFKFHPLFDRVLKGILEADPDAELVVLEGRVSAWTDRLKQRWATALPDASRRVRFLPTVPREQFFQLLNLADVVLDPFPFGGGNSSYEALSMGVPIVTLPSEYLCGRITHALYQKIGHTSDITRSHEDYVHKALKIANQSADKAAQRQDLQTAAHKLFQDLEEVRELEVEFERIVRDSSL